MDRNGLCCISRHDQRARAAGLQLILAGSLSWTIVLLPLIFVPLILVTLGFSWFFAATGVYLRDIGQVSGLITSVLLFVSPVFYPVSVLPPPIRSLVMLNPLTLIIEESRKVLLFGETPNWIGLAIYTLVCRRHRVAGFLVVPERQGRVSPMSSDDIAIRVRGLSKCYQIYDRPQDRLKQSIIPRVRRMMGCASLQPISVNFGP